MERPDPSVSFPRAAALRVAVFFVVALLAVGCVTVKEQGDRAFDAGNYKEAMAYYQEAIDEGSEDADLYANAARAELKLGNLASAERYYARALRFGGGTKIAKELARYYVQTSNYTNAVRVYQVLLYESKNPQPVYNNLGTALIYAGRPFDAESYLLVAQQMDPRDPFPYLNLGMLYDQHLKQPWLAINFYECFAELAPQTDQAVRVRQRVNEIGSRWQRLYDPAALKCGEVYEPKMDSPNNNLRAELSDEAIDLDFSDESSTSTSETPDEIIIERMVESLPKTEEEAKAEPAAADNPLSLGRVAFARKQWEATVDLLGQVKLADLQARDLRMLGAAYYKLGRFHDSVQWLQMVTNREPTVDSVKLLVDAQYRLSDFKGVGMTCDRYGEQEKLEGVFEHCAARLKALQEEVGDTVELPEQKLEEGGEGSQ